MQPRSMIVYQQETRAVLLARPHDAHEELAHLVPEEGLALI